MGKLKRKTYTAKFKGKVGLEAIRATKTVNEIGQEYGVHPVQVNQWKKEIQQEVETLFETKRGRKQDVAVSEHESSERLFSEIGRLKMELDWLKKKSGMSL
jgi:transposase